MVGFLLLRIVRYCDIIDRYFNWGPPMFLTCPVCGKHKLANHTRTRGYNRKLFSDHLVRIHNKHKRELSLLLDKVVEGWVD